MFALFVSLLADYRRYIYYINQFIWPQSNSAFLFHFLSDDRFRYVSRLCAGRQRSTFADDCLARDKEDRISGRERSRAERSNFQATGLVFSNSKDRTPPSLRADCDRASSAWPCHKSSLLYIFRSTLTGTQRAQTPSNNTEAIPQAHGSPLERDMQSKSQKDKDKRKKKEEKKANLDSGKARLVKILFDFSSKVRIEVFTSTAWYLTRAAASWPVKRTQLQKQALSLSIFQQGEHHTCTIFFFFWKPSASSQSAL